MYDFRKIPFKKIKQFGHTTMLNKDLFCVSWLLGRYCNYKCSYCWNHGRSDIKDHRPTSLLISTMKKIKKQARENGFNSFSFSFSGGEPTLHPGYLDLLEYYAADDTANFQAHHMTSNLSRGQRWFEKYIEVTKPLKRQYITSSWHREFSDKQKFIEKCQFLIANDIQVTINIVMVPAWFNRLYDEALWFENHGINVTLKPQSNPNATAIVEGYTDDMLKRLQTDMPQKYIAQGTRTDSNLRLDNSNEHYEIELLDEDGKTWFLDQAERLNAFNFNNFEGWKCNAGYQSIIIREPDGSIKRSYSCHDEPLGYIDKDFTLFKEAQTCITKSCVSSADSKIPKEKIPFIP